MVSNGKNVGQCNNEGVLSLIDFDIECIDNKPLSSKIENRLNKYENYDAQFTPLELSNEQLK